MARSSAASAGGDADRAPRTDAERAWLEAEVDAALAPYRGALPEDDLAFMRERLLAGAEDELVDLIRAAAPREVDESGEILIRKPSTDR